MGPRSPHTSRTLEVERASAGGSGGGEQPTWIQAQCKFAAPLSEPATVCQTGSQRPPPNPRRVFARSPTEPREGKPRAFLGRLESLAASSARERAGEASASPQPPAAAKSAALYRSRTPPKGYMDGGRRSQKNKRSRPRTRPSRPGTFRGSGILLSFSSSFSGFLRACSRSPGASSVVLPS